MKNKKIAGVGIAGTVAATAVTALLIGASPAVADEGDGFGSAFAIEATGLLPIEPMKLVQSDGELVRDEVLSIGERTELENAGFFVGVLNSAAEAGKAEASVLRLELVELLRADVFRTFCDGGEGGVELLNGTLLGQELPRFPVPSETVDVSPLVKASFNNQTRNTDGSLTVTGLELTLLPGLADGEDNPLSAADRAGLPALGDLLGVELPTTLATEGAVADELTSARGVGFDDALQTITVGSATCSDDGKRDDVKKDEDKKDEDKRDDGAVDEDKKDDGPSVDKDDGPSVDKDDEDGDTVPADGGPAAPAPTVVPASLPVTG